MLQNAGSKFDAFGTLEGELGTIFSRMLFHKVFARQGVVNANFTR